MTLQIKNFGPVTGDVSMLVLDNDGHEQAIIDQSLASGFRVRWQVTGQLFWAYVIGNSQWRVRIGVESFGPAQEHSFPPAAGPPHFVAANAASINFAAETATWATEVPVPPGVYDSDVVYKAVAAVDFRVDPLIVPVAVPVAGFAEGTVFQTQQDPTPPGP